ncbi:MAG: hypothetical protein ACQGVK_00060 [Myxococcota bacterium]
MSSDPVTQKPPQPLPADPHPGAGATLIAPFNAAASIVLLARWLPLSFTWQPNDLGIVSATVVEQYPTQQETIWFALCVALGIALVWLGASGLDRRALRPPTVLGLETLAFAALGASLLLGRGAAVAGVATLGAVQLAWLWRRPRAEPISAETPSEAAFAPPSRRRVVSWVVGLALLCLLRTPSLVVALRWMAEAVPDLALAGHAWVFQVEVGQHLAWTDALWNGGLHGRDFFCLYGPLYNWGGVAIWTLASRSIRAWYLYAGLGDFVGLASLLLLGSALLRRRAWVVLLIPLVVFVNLRMGLPLLGLWLLARGLRGARPGWLLASGAVGGLALLYSQEFALAFVCAAIPVLAVRRSGAGALAFGIGLVFAMAPLVVAYAVAGALGPLLEDLAGYPGWVMAGFGNLPFPGLSRWLPLALPLPSDDVAVTFRLGWLTGAAPVALIGLAVPRLDLRGRGVAAWLLGAFESLRHDPRRLALIATGIFGVLAQRSVFGRSDLFHVQAVVPVTALVLVVAVDRIVPGPGADPGRRAVAAGRLALLAAVAWLGGFADHVVPASYAYTRVSLSHVAAQLGGRPVPGRVDPAIERAVAWIREHSRADDPVFFVPNNAAWYYLVGRPNPTRFAVTHQMVTDAHRAEALADLEANPPRFVVWDDRALRIDGVPDERVMGERMLAFLDAHYEPARRFGPLRVLARRGDPGAEAAR